MKKIVLTLIAFTCLVKANATDLSLYEQTGLISEKYLGIHQQLPEGYIRENLSKFRVVTLNCNSEQLKNHKLHFGFAYYEFAISKDGESKLLYPFFLFCLLEKHFYTAVRICHSTKLRGRVLAKYRQHKVADYLKMSNYTRKAIGENNC